MQNRAETKNDYKNYYQMLCGEGRTLFVNVESDFHVSLLVKYLTDNDSQNIVSLTINNDSFTHRPETTLYADLSSLTQIKELTVQKGVVCIQLPPKLYTLSCSMQNLLYPFKLPSSLRKFVLEFVEEIHRAEKLTTLIKANQQITDLSIFNGYHSEINNAVIDAIFSRSVPLDTFWFDSGTCFTTEQFQKIACSVVDLSYSQLDKACCSHSFDCSQLPVTLKKINFFPKFLLSWLKGNWTFFLEEMTISTNVGDNYQLLIDAILPRPNLKIFNLKFPKKEHIQFFAKQSKLFPFCTVKLFFSFLKKENISAEFLQAIQSETNALIKLEDFTVCIRHNLEWQPRYHNKFPMSAQRTLNALTMGFTRLKKFPHLAHKKDCKKQEVLVHVDPACIEWIMEKICVKDFV